LKILFVNEKCGYFGGVEQNIADSTRLRQRGHPCFLAWEEETERDVEGFRRRFDDHGRFRGSDDLARLVECWDPDVVYLHKIGRVEPILGALGGRRTVRMVHDHALCCPREHKYFLHNGRVCTAAAGWRCYADGAFLARARKGPLPVALVSIPDHLREMEANKRVDRLLVASGFMRDELRVNGFPEERIRLLPLAVDLPPVLSVPVPGNGRVLYLGQLIRGKGVDLLLQAMARVDRVFTLDIVGTGNASEALRALATRLGLAERVRFHGWVPPGPAQSALYDAADVVVVPSRWPEPFGLVGLQAMRHARPVVAFEVGGIVDWLEHGRTGLLVPEQDVAAFAAAVRSLLDDVETARELGGKAAEAAAERFSFEGYLDGLERALQLDPIIARR
jgi:glycosyltransferase involved in cell wall biosynthesis